MVIIYHLQRLWHFIAVYNQGLSINDLSVLGDQGFYDDSINLRLNTKKRSGGKKKQYDVIT